MIHAMKFDDHIPDRGEWVILMDLNQVETTWSTPLEIGQDAHEHGEFISGKMINLIRISHEENDYTSEPLLSWFLNEQIEEEKNSDDVARELAMIGNSRDGILMLDRKLGARIFSPGAPLDPVVYNVAG